MRNLLWLLKRYNFFFLFLLLEVAALMLVFRYHNYQRSVFISSSNLFAGTFYNLKSTISDYFSLKRVNQQLSEENARLLAQTPNSFLKTDLNVFTFEDTIYNRHFQYINAGVINNSLNRRNNFITLDKGSNHGIKPDMGVITFSGPVGIVVNVSRNFCTVISVLNTDFQASVRVKRNNYVGSLIWKGDNYKLAKVTHIPGHVDLEVGDTIVTSGLSPTFPSDILVGTVRDFEMQGGGNFLTASIDLSQDFNRLRYVMVVKNLFKEELETLEEKTR